MFSPPNISWYFELQFSRQTVCVTCVWADVDNAWEQKKLEARKMLENAAREASHTSGARFVRRRYLLRLLANRQHIPDIKKLRSTAT
jgi:hypothetical protein